MEDLSFSGSESSFSEEVLEKNENGAFKRLDEYDHRNGTQNNQIRITNNFSEFNKNSNNDNNNNNNNNNNSENPQFSSLALSALDVPSAGEFSLYNNNHVNNIEKNIEENENSITYKEIDKGKEKRTRHLHDDLTFTNTMTKTKRKSTRTTNIMILLIKAFHNELYSPLLLPYKNNLIQACEDYVTKYSDCSNNTELNGKIDILQKTAIYRMQYMVTSYIQIRQNKLMANPSLYSLAEWAPLLTKIEKIYVDKMAELQKKDLWNCFLSRVVDHTVNNYSCKKKFVEPVYEKLFEQKLVENMKKDIKKSRDSFVQIRVLQDFMGDPLQPAEIQPKPLPEAYIIAKGDPDLSVDMTTNTLGAEENITSMIFNDTRVSDTTVTQSQRFTSELDPSSIGFADNLNSNMIMFKKDGLYFTRYSTIEKALLQGSCELTN